MILRGIAMMSQHHANQPVFRSEFSQKFGAGKTMRPIRNGKNYLGNFKKNAVSGDSLSDIVSQSQ
jgi:hypothetical protein